MLKKHGRSLEKALSLVDVLTVVLSLSIVSYWRFGSEFISFLATIQYRILSLVYIVCWLYLSKRFHLYGSRRTSRFREEIWAIGKTATLSLSVALAPAFFIREFPVSRIFLAHLWACQILLLISSRFFLRQALQYFRSRGYNYRNILIVGRNSRSAEMADRIEQAPELGLRILGFVDSLKGNRDRKGVKELPLFGTVDELETIVKGNVVDEVLIFLPIKSFYQEIQKTIHICETAGVEAKIPTDLFTRKIARSTISHYEGISVIDLYTSPKMNIQLFAKRIIDITLSAILLVLLSPIFLLVSILIKATSPGPVFFVQSRVGYNGRQFSCFKFRTMIEDAEKQKKNLMRLNEISGPVFKMKNDPRVTSLGRWLRKASVDELPQLANVFLGDMSLVGPRPPVPSEVDQYDLCNHRRLSMRPGITCLWQVNGRNDIPFEKWMELDRQYIDQWSLGLDAKILFKTIPAVFRASGAS
ncbi:MAG: sugar transferase [Desulfobacteraceae bacterium]|nr:MAG: sugar transferase [Desulfobacteraceae bacterium]